MTKKTKDEARSWLWIGIMCVFMALVVISSFFLIPPEKMSGKPTGYALAAVFFTVGCLIIVFRKNIAQWGTGETSRPSGEAIADWREEECKVQFDANGKVSSIEVLQRQRRWLIEQRGSDKYYSQKAGSLLWATEVLKRLDSIPPFTYYQHSARYGAARPRFSRANCPCQV